MSLMRQNHRDNVAQNHVRVLTQEQVQAVFDLYPAGFRFNPRDEELVVFYLREKLLDQPLPLNLIKEVELYAHHPQELVEGNRSYGEGEWYFFTPRDKKYPNGSRPRRSAGREGYWKATGADRTLIYEGAEVGYRKALVFYNGKPSAGKKTNWMMHEFRLKDPPALPKSNPHNQNNMQLDKWVLCKIYKKAEKNSKTSADADEAENSCETEELDSQRQTGSLGVNDQAPSPFNKKRLRLDDLPKSKLGDDSPKLKLDESDDQDQYASLNNGVASITPKYPDYYNEAIWDQSSSLYLGNNLHDPYDDYNINIMADPVPSSFDGLGFLPEFHDHHYYYQIP
ncbi:No apical meristem (NAM) protein [Corchorus olitorius]|uniref:No apical meristem (NAM) protein n=1 Tax=Corchorus olitorius TaxID=93759 RepID=A0A1R3GDM5_9ROSI|nr:No apical meristem (NAM) protein [Corchorus olitorius]